MQNVINQLVSVRRRMRMLLILQRACVAVAWALGVLLALVLFDFIARLPQAARVAQLGALIALAAWMIWRYLWPAVAFNPSLVSLALRIERRLPQLQGRLASGIEFSMAGVDRSSPLAARAIADAEHRVGRENLGREVNRRRLMIDLGAAAGALALVIGVSVAAPSAASIGARRILIPFSDAEWPKRTGVESRIDFEAHPLGVSVPLRAEVTRGFNEDMRVYANYREIRNGREGDPKRIMLTHQRDQRFERLIESDADSIELWFSTEDDRTSPQLIRLVPAPAIREAPLRVTPPAYAASAIDPIEADLGPGLDQRAVTPQPALIGSEVSLTLMFNKPIPAPATREEVVEMLGWQVQTASERSAAPEFEFDAAPDDEGFTAGIRLEWRLRGTTSLRPRLIDAYGIPSVEEAAYRIDAVADKPPTISITDPISDLAVLPTALIDLAAEARDDVAVERAWMELRLVPDENGGDESSVDDDGEAAPANAEAAPATLVDIAPAASPAEMTASLDLAEYGAKPGQTLEALARADDTFALDGLEHEPVASTPRRLRIIAASEFVEQIYRDLSAVRDNAIRIDEDEGALRDKMSEHGLSPGDRVEQARIGERVGRQSEAIERINERMDRNRFEDSELRETLERAAATLIEAGESSNYALDAMAGLDGDETEPTPEERQALQNEADEAQREVQTRMTELAELLDQGEDSWVMRRHLEELLSRQQDIAEASEEIGKQTRGRELSELSNDERQSLERLGEQQAELADQAEGLTERLRERSAELRENDPELAEAMKQAADRASERELEQKMASASEQLQENQTENASQNQQAAMAALQEMLKQLEQIDKARAERLQRQLASIVESLTNLVERQQAELDALIAAGEQLDGLDDPMIQLNQNTYGVLELIEQTGQEVARVAPIVEAAAEAQEAAIVALRAEPGRSADAQSGEEQSLAKLTEARDLAKKLLEQAEQQANEQKKEELKRAYRELLQRQTQLLTETDPLVDGRNALDRRERMVARGVADRQAEIQSDASRVFTETQELAEAFVFRLSHDDIDELSNQVITQLRGERLDARVLMWEQDLVDRFAALLAALEEDENPSEFEQAGGAGGGGAGGAGGQPQPLIPPVAQVKLLRGLQQSVYKSTRTLDELGGQINDAAAEARLEELGSKQSELVELADELLRQMSEQGGNTAPPSNVEPDVGPAPPVDDEP